MNFVYELYFLFNNESSCTNLSFLKKNHYFHNQHGGIQDLLLVSITFYISAFSPRMLNYAKQDSKHTSLSSNQEFLNVWHHQEAIACTATVTRT